MCESLFDDMTEKKFKFIFVINAAFRIFFAFPLEANAAISASREREGGGMCCHFSGSAQSRRCP